MVMRKQSSVQGRGRGRGGMSGRGGRGVSGRGGFRGRGGCNRGRQPNTRIMFPGGTEGSKSDLRSLGGNESNVMSESNLVENNAPFLDEKMEKKSKEQSCDLKNSRIVSGDTTTSTRSQGHHEKKSKPSKGKKGKKKSISSNQQIPEDHLPKSTSPGKGFTLPKDAKVESQFGSTDVREKFKVCGEKTVFETPSGPFIMSPISKLSLSPGLVEKKPSKEIADGLRNETLTPHPTKVEISEELSYCVSRSTGLFVFSVTNSNPGHLITLTDRANIIKNIPGVVLVNSWGKGDSLIIGVDTENALMKTISEELQDWIVTPLDLSKRDVFGFLAGWNEIPRVDGMGLYQLVVKFSRNNTKASRKEELQMRNRLLSSITSFNIAKIVHGEGESIIQVCHVLEFIAYHDAIKTLFPVEKRHSWQPRPSISTITDTIINPEFYFWLKMNSSETSPQLSPAHEQFSVFHSLTSAGYRVVHLEHQLFGIPANYLVALNIPSKEQNAGQAVESLKRLCPQLSFLELDQEYLPDQYLPNYMVDNHGFYSVAGTFPSHISTDLRNKFADDMKNIGAVGFRSEEVESNSFSLHFVNSCCLDTISRDNQFSMFNLVIQSSKVKKLASEKSLKKLVPIILKYKEIMKAKKDKEQLVDNVTSFIDETMSDCFANPEASDKIMKSEEVQNDGATSEVNPAERLEFVGNQLSQSVEGGKLDQAKAVKKNKEKVKSKDKFSKHVKFSEELSIEDLLSMRWKMEKTTLHSYLGGIVKFVQKFNGLTVSGDSDNLTFSFSSVLELEKVISSLCSDETNSVEKLRNNASVVEMKSSKYHNDKYGLLVRRITPSKLSNYFESVGSVDVESRSNCTVAWFESQVDMFKALLLGIKKNKSVKSASPHCSPMFSLCTGNFYLAKKPDANCDKVKLIEKPVEVEEKLAKAVTDVSKNVIRLTEKELFSFYWKSKRQDRSEEKAYSRYLTNFIKTVQCDSLSTNEDGLVMTFSDQSQLEDTLEKYCKEPSNSTEKLEDLCPSFTLIPSRGSYGLYSVKRVKPEHFHRFGDCKAKNNSIWFSSKLSLVQTLRDPFILRTYPAVWIDCRNVYILQRNHQLYSATVGVKVGFSSTRSNTHGRKKSCGDEQLPAKPVLTQDIINTSDAVDNSTTSDTQGEKVPQLTCPTLASLLSSCQLKTAQKFTNPSCSLYLVNKDKFRSVTPKQAACVIEKMIGGDSLSESNGTLKEIKMSRVEHFLKEKLGLSSVEENQVKNVPVTVSSVEEVVTEQNGNCVNIELDPARVSPEVDEDELTDVFKEESIEDDKYEVHKELESSTVSKSVEDIEAERARFEETAFIYPDDLKRVVNDSYSPNATYSLNESFANKEMDLRAGDEKPSATIKESLCEAKESNNIEVESTGTIEQSLEESNMVEETVVNELVEETVVNVLDHLNAGNEMSGELQADWLGFYTLLVTVDEDKSLETIEDDFAWYDGEVLVTKADMNNEESGPIMVRMKDVDLASAALAGLKKKYPSLSVKSPQVDIYPAKETGLYTFSFSDIHKKRFKATMDHFKKYSSPRSSNPLISKGEKKDQILVSYVNKDSAKLAMLENLDNVEFPNVQVIPACRGIE